MIRSGRQIQDVRIAVDRILEPDNPEGYFNLSEALAADEKLEEAVKAYIDGLKRAPKDTEALTALGDLYFEMGRHKDALGSYKKIIAVEPDNADGYAVFFQFRDLFNNGAKKRRVSGVEPDHGLPPLYPVGHEADYIVKVHAPAVHLFRSRT